MKLWQINHPFLKECILVVADTIDDAIVHAQTMERYVHLSPAMLVKRTHCINDNFGPGQPIRISAAAFGG